MYVITNNIIVNPLEIKTCYNTIRLDACALISKRVKMWQPSVSGCSVELAGAAGTDTHSGGW